MGQAQFGFWLSGWARPWHICQPTPPPSAPSEPTDPWRAEGSCTVPGRQPGGVLSLLATREGEPIVPGVLLADIAAGSYPAFMNVLLALYERERTGRGTHLDVAMARNLSPFTIGARAGVLFTGGSPRYRTYLTRDGRALAVAALEPNFWNEFCERIELPTALRDYARDPAATASAVERTIAAKDAREWAELLEPYDTCAALLVPLDIAAPLSLPLALQLCRELAPD